jgi:regulator of RNase E activity RraA
VVVVPLADVGAVVEAAEAKRDAEAATRAAIEAGTPLPAP